MPKYKKLYIYCDYCDGGCRGNPSPAAIGITMFNSQKEEVHNYSECIGDSTNNRAEYHAIIKALELAVAHCRKELICFSDSELVIRQLSGIYAIKNKELRKLFDLLKSKEKAFEKVTYHHVKRTNKFISKVDELVNKTLDGNGF